MSQEVVILGGQGVLGTLVGDLLARRGYQVTPASRRTGVDVATGKGLTEALCNAHVVIDCLNIETMSRATAIDFFTAAAGNVAKAAIEAAVPHLICVSIVNVDKPQVAKAMGYYAGKAAQEKAYREAKLPLTVVRSTQWFELGEQLAHRMAVGPVALIPAMGIQPLAASSVAELVARVVQEGPGANEEVRQIAGPEPTTMADLARRTVRHNRSGPRIITLPVPIAALRTGLLPGPDIPRDTVTIEEWMKR